MHRLYNIFFTLFLMVNIAFTQDRGSESRTIMVYLNAFSGNLTEDPNSSIPRLFNENEMEFGVSYFQNFSSALWLTLSVKMNVITGVDLAYGQNGEFLGYRNRFSPGIGSPNYFQSDGIPRVQVGIDLGGYSFIGIDTRGMVVNENYLSAGPVTFFSLLEFYAFPLVTAVADNESLPAQVGGNATGVINPSKIILNLVAVGLDYSANIHENLVFNTSLSVRFEELAFSLLDETDIADIKITAESFLETLEIRWENKLFWSVTDKFYMWTQVRYSIRNLIDNSDIVKRTVQAGPREIDHQVGIEAGLGYCFDI